MAGCKCKNGGKVRNPGCGCGGKVANPRKRRNPAKLVPSGNIRADVRKLNILRGTAMVAGTVEGVKFWRKTAKQFAQDLLDAYDVRDLSVRDRVTIEEGAEMDVNDFLPPVPRREMHPKRRNPVHAASEDYKLGLIQGALERGKLPPPSSSSADLKRGYADGHKVAKAMPAARSEALGVLKATGSHLKAGESLYEAAKGSKNATLSQNPRSSVANVLAGIARKHLRFETLDTRRMGDLDFREVAVWSVESALEEAYRAGSGGHKPPARLLAGIARKHLRFETLDTRNMDDLDFREVAVWSVKSALEEAYRAGKQAASRGKTSNPMSAAAYVAQIKKIGKNGGLEDWDIHWALHHPSEAQSKHPAQAQVGRIFLKAKKAGLGNDVMVKFEESIGLLANPSKHRNPARRKSFQSKFIKLLEDIKRAEQAQRDAINEHGYFSPITKEAYKAVGRALDAMDKYREASRGKTSNPMSAAARKHLAHEKSEERSFASLMSKMPQGETVMLGKHRVRKLGKGYVVVDGVRLTTTQAAAKIHRGK